jgi:hypothetical protein
MPQATKTETTKPIQPKAFVPLRKVCRLFRIDEAIPAIERAERYTRAAKVTVKKWTPVIITEVMFITSRLVFVNRSLPLASPAIRKTLAVSATSETTNIKAVVKYPRICKDRTSSPVLKTFSWPAQKDLNRVDQNCDWAPGARVMVVTVASMNAATKNEEA